ncbi:MAG: DUF4011 domain-containing protein [Cytophagales bacterium]|nr:MAG: DUF4011 domain-containing protein [Cytophagales bacterium]TAF61473.1 MAG: DUF4011 domain-containing protein [Cytophagales bacterium]
MQKVLRLYQKRLTNLSANNRSLLLLKLLSGQFVDLHEADFLLKNSSFYIIKQLLSKAGKISLCAELDSRHKPSNVLSRQLKMLSRMDKNVADECGAQDLYVGYPFVEGKLLDDTLIRCPLLFFPVSLEKQENMWFLKPRDAQQIVFNKSFLLAYSHFNQIRLDDNIQDADFDEFSKDSLKFLTELYQLLKESSLELDFNPETLAERLETFRASTKQEWQQTQQQGRLRLSPNAVLGLFPQAGSYLSPDYDFLLQADEHSDLAGYFKGIQQPTRVVQEEDIYNIFEHDASQEAVLRAVRSGDSVVVQGPPGTGKSQVISNLIADAAARHQRVLLVCQKKAALDVVFERLKAKSLGQFIALVHDFRHDRKDILTKVAAQIDSLEAYEQENNGLDTVFLEREFKQACRTIDRIASELEDFKQAFFNTNLCGLSPKDLYLSSHPQQPHVALQAQFKQFHFSSYKNFLQIIRRYAQYGQALDKPGYLWQKRQSFETYQHNDLSAFVLAIKEIPQFKQQLTLALGQLLGISVLPYPNCEALWLLEPECEQLLEYIKDERTFAFMKTAFPHKSAQIDWLDACEARVLETFEGEGIETHLTLADLDRVEEAAKAYKEAQSQMFSKIYWQLFSPTQKKLVEESLLRNDLTSSPESLDILIKRLQKRRILERELLDLKAAVWLMDVPHNLRKELFVRWFAKYKTALKAKFLLQKLLAFTQTDLNIPDQLHKPFQELLITVYAKLSEIPLKKQQWRRWLTEAQIGAIFTHEPLAEELCSTLQTDFDLLCEFDRLRASLRPHEQESIELLYQHLKSYESESMIRLFENSLRLCWLNELESHSRILRSVSGLAYEQNVQLLTEATAQKAVLNTQFLLLKAKERTYKNVQYNRQKNRSTYKDLEHQCKKKRGIWPLRKLISTFETEIFDLLPCWIASPESVSALFDINTHFDLVIFDEASQCFAERGIPSLFRARQVVIAGDDKQLRPSDLYMNRWDDSELLEEASVAEQTALEVESLLDLGKQFLPEYTLLGHYRSQALPLIAFSNEHFYQNKLRIIPHFSTLQQPQNSIRYLKVEGTNFRSQNQDEAMEVVRLVKSLIYSGKKDIGIITFNYKQQELITDLLDLMEIALPSSFFVKNIENVQGDERNIIIFSVGYAPSESGRFEAKFGSLNLEGGENRLNVAVSRAREQIYVVSSIWPHELNVEKTSNKGPKMLKAYLQYALDVSEGHWEPSLSLGENKPSFSQFLWQNLKDKWQNSSYKLESNLPFADLSVLNDKAHLTALVRTDDQIYHAALSAKDAHVYVPALLTAKGWPHRRLHSRNFWLNPVSEVEQLKLWVSETAQNTLS